jgi:hypothetical protein
MLSHNQTVHTNIPLVGCPRLLIQCIRSYPSYPQAFPPSATWGRAMPWCKGPTYHGTSYLIKLKSTTTHAEAQFYPKLSALLLRTVFPSTPLFLPHQPECLDIFLLIPLNQRYWTCIISQLRHFYTLSSNWHDLPQFPTQRTVRMSALTSFLLLPSISLFPSACHITRIVANCCSYLNSWWRNNLARLIPWRLTLDHLVQWHYAVRPFALCRPVPTPKTAMLCTQSKNYVTYWQSTMAFRIM